MTRRRFVSVILVAVFVANASSAPARANPLWAAVKWAGSYLLGKGVDGLWDKATGKPDVRALDRRLEKVEDTLRSYDGELADAVEDLRDRVSSNTSKMAYYEMAVGTLTDLSRRVAALESRVSDNESAIRRLEARMDAVERQISNPREEARKQRGETPEHELARHLATILASGFYAILVKSDIDDGEFDKAIARCTEMLEVIEGWDIDEFGGELDESKAEIIAMVYAMRAEAYGELDVHELSIDDYTKAIKLTKDVDDLARYHNNRGVEKSKKGDRDGAKSDYLRAHRLKPGKELYKRNLGI